MKQHCSITLVTAQQGKSEGDEHMLGLYAKKRTMNEALKFSLKFNNIPMYQTPNVDPLKPKRQVKGSLLVIKDHA